MKKIVILVIAVVLLLGLIATPALAKGKDGQAGNSNTGHLYLYEKDTSWTIVPGGAWGKMKYNLSGPELCVVFNGHGLNPGVEYTLIYYPDPWPGNGLISLGSATANKGGNVHIKGCTNTGDLPASYDTAPLGGAKIWLVLSTDVDYLNKKMKGWNPTDYLFENDVITFNDTDVP